MLDKYVKIIVRLSYIYDLLQSKSLIGSLLTNTIIAN